MGKTTISKVNNKLGYVNYDSFLAGEYIFSLPILFTFFESKKLDIRNYMLKRNISKSMKIIQEVELKDRRRFVKRSFKSYLPKQIVDLGDILSQFECCLKVGFKDEIAAANRIQIKYINDDDSWGIVRSKFKEYEKSTRKTLGLKKQKPQFYIANEPKEFSTDDDIAKYLLKTGLFDYLQRLVNGDRYRPRKCLVCEEWFVAAKKNKLTCSIKCKNKRYSVSPGGKIKKREIQKRYRKNVKKRGSRQMK